MLKLVVMAVDAVAWVIGKAIDLAWALDFEDLEEWGGTDETGQG